MTSSGKNGLNIRTNASPKWDMTRCPELQIYGMGKYINFFYICLENEMQEKVRGKKMVLG